MESGRGGKERRGVRRDEGKVRDQGMRGRERKGLRKR